MEKFENPPERLWKYCKWSQFTPRLIVNGEVHFAKTEEFNDPFDCQWCDRFPKDKAELMRLCRRFCFSQWPDLDRDSLEELVGNMYRQALAYSKQRKSGIAHTSAKFSEGVFCMAEVNDDILMWSHYANYHKGVCLSILPARMKPKRILKVQYQEELPIVDFRDYAEANRLSFVEVARRKSLRWAYDHEWRTIHFAGEKCFPGVVDRVVIGARADEATRAGVLQAVRRATHSIKVFEAVVNDVKYKLNIRPLQIPS